MRVDYENSLDLTDKPIGTIYLTGGGFVNRAFQGWGTDSLYGWQEMVWKKSPTRGGTFAFTNIDDIDVGLVARCEISTKYMNIQDFMDLRKIVGRERHFLATFFDSDEGKWVTRDMYCSENSKNQLFVLKKHLIGVRDITVKLVGTNLDQQTTIDADGNEVTTNATLSIVYNINSGSGSIETETAEYGSQIKLNDGSGIIAPTGKHLALWEAKMTVDGVLTTVGQYGLGQSITLWKGLTLYPKYETV